MTQKFSAADFANARFAEHPDGRGAHRVERRAVCSWSLERLSGESDHASGEYMAHHGWVPVTTKPTLTDSQLEEACGQWYESDDFLMGFITGYEKAGGTVLEETTRERVARLVNEAVDGRGIVPVGEKVADRLINLGLVKDN